MAEDAPRRQPTLAEVAELAGVSRSVASRALNDAPHVSRAKREAVARAVRQLGYVPNPTARALATRHTGAAALVVSGEDPSIFADPFFAQVIVGASTALEEADLHLTLCLAASDRGRKRVEELFRSKGADGVMLMALREDDPLAGVAEEAEMPVVFGGRPVGSAPRWYVDVDNVGGAREATEYLVSRGRTRVAAICGRLDTEAGRARYRGYRDALLAAGLDPLPPQEGDFTEPSGAAAMAGLLAHHPDVDGVFAANDNMAAGALRTLRAAGRAVPADIAVVGFDDLTVAQVADPPLTTVHQPITALGREMARMLVTVINGHDPTPLILPTRLVTRSSA
ncbi:LacI family DNA-binding transcriptional regulator [Streptomyces caelestis]|jgi:DNA-binding LacI/PurR family transcriptional regulator|uniref:DNA-binding LacI/PurR family transcriptional regulator n=1 Tax=Streptomyces caelestis TaxID=36816 RepID=A0A7W9HD50_9ACTN|nr:LacI family DNA-binding transcriptional regulator [Streptomyces caelestis]MBB5800072.1 DNA-binding LacI/PurR family transcriptional regulator [Streptomyces caelestis]GGW76605.1 transcriptional regulator [Streptomyces caelestis]